VIGTFVTRVLFVANLYAAAASFPTYHASPHYSNTHNLLPTMADFAEIIGPVLLFGLVFGMSGTVEIKALFKQIRNAKAICICLAMQFLLLPAIGFLCVKLFDLPAEIGIILLVITTSPGGSYSNWWCSLFNAELALSVTMTTVSTLLSVILLPTNLILYTRFSYNAAVVKSLDWGALIISLITVISGITGGLLASYIATQRGRTTIFRTRANRIGNVAGIMLIVLSFTVSSTDQDTSLWNRGPKFYIGVALPAIFGLCMSVYLSLKAQLTPPERVAVAVEACYQNTGIATSMALTLYKDEALADAIGVPLYYGMVEACLLAIFCLICWKLGWTKAPRDENLCVILYHSYEVDESEEGEEAAAGAATGGDLKLSEGTAEGTIGGEAPDVVVGETSKGTVIMRRSDAEQASVYIEPTTSNATPSDPSSLPAAENAGSVQRIRQAVTSLPRLAGGYRKPPSTRSPEATPRSVLTVDVPSGDVDDSEVEGYATVLLSSPSHDEIPAHGKELS
jgi:predicted Na+-dependent transporter